MSEIKGQLLGIVLLLTIFGVVSVGIAAVFKASQNAVVEKADSMFDEDGTLVKEIEQAAGKQTN